MKLKKYMGVSLMAATLIMTGCSKKSDSGTVSTLSELESLNQQLVLSGVSILTPTQMANTSNEDITQNNWGLVTADKVKAWVDNWVVNKPAHIEGKLFIMQMGLVLPNDANYDFIKHDDVNVFTFDRTAGCTTTGDFRNDGNSDMPKPVFTKDQMNQAFQAYGLDPTKDMVLLVLGEDDGTGEYMAGAARMAYTLKYWGIDSTHIALMNGSALYNFHPSSSNGLTTQLSDMFVANQSTPPMNGTKLIQTVKKDGTALQISMQEMMNKVINFNSSTDLILDARSASEYAGTSSSKAEDSNCDVSGTSPCLTAFEGHIKNAQHLEFKSTFNMADQGVLNIDLNGDGYVDSKDASYKFKDLTTLRTMFANAGYTPGKTIYTYCRTGTKASVLTYVAGDILGYPVRMFDGSWIQWGKMANVINKDGVVNLTSDSRLRVDLTNYSELITLRSNPLLVNPIHGLDGNYTGTSKIILEDKRAKL